MIEPFKSKSILGIKKARGQMDLILNMLNEGRYCADIIQQCNSAIGILRQTNNVMLEGHLHTCGKKLNSKDRKEKETFIKEIIRACTISNRKN